MDPKGVPWTLLGVIWGPLGDFLGSLDVLLAAMACLGGGSWDVAGRLEGDFRKFQEVFWLHFGIIFGVFSLTF